jgi:hypothetical protein
VPVVQWPSTSAFQADDRSSNLLGHSMKLSHINWDGTEYDDSGDRFHLEFHLHHPGGKFNYHLVLNPCSDENCKKEHVTLDLKGITCAA